MGGYEDLAALISRTRGPRASALTLPTQDRSGPGQRANAQAPWADWHSGRAPHGPNAISGDAEVVWRLHQARPGSKFGLSAGGHNFAGHDATAGHSLRPGH